MQCLKKNRPPLNSKFYPTLRSLVFNYGQLSSLAKHTVFGVPPRKLNNDILPVVNGFWKEIKGYFGAEEKEKKKKEEKVAGTEMVPRITIDLLL